MTTEARQRAYRLGHMAELRAVWRLRLRVARAASLFLAHHPRYAAHSVRFDAILVVGWWPRHLPDVWRPPE